MGVTRIVSMVSHFRGLQSIRFVHNVLSRWSTLGPPGKPVSHRLTDLLSRRNLSCSRLAPVSLQLTSSGRDLVIQSEGKDLSYHPTWLRQNCQCPSCTASSGQKKFSPTDIRPSLTLRSATLSGEQLELVWSCGHHGYIEIDWLKRTATQSREDRTDPTTATELPVLKATEVLEDKEMYWKWLHWLDEYGVCLLTDLGTEKRAVVKLAEIMYNVQHTIYGEVFDVEAKEDFINIAYSTEYLEVHMDLVYYESPPGLQLLHCLRFDDCVEGGESVMLDMLPVVEEMRDKWPEHFSTLSRVPATFQKIHYKRDEPVDIVRQCPHIQLDSTGRVVEMTWSPPFEGPLSVPQGDMLPYYQAYHCLATLLEDSKLKLRHRLKPGEVMTFNNRRVLHGRNEFSLRGGQRHLQGVYVNIDHFKSSYQVLCKQLKKTVPIKRVFNKNSK